MADWENNNSEMSRKKKHLIKITICNLTYTIPSLPQYVAKLKGRGDKLPWHATIDGEVEGVAAADDCVENKDNYLHFFVVQERTYTKQNKTKPKSYRGVHEKGFLSIYYLYLPFFSTFRFSFCPILIWWQQKEK